jgi:hypothetical protein
MNELIIYSQFSEVGGYDHIHEDLAKLWCAGHRGCQRNLLFLPYFGDMLELFI